jgi:ribosomal protein L10
MADRVTNELMYETLKAIRGELSDLRSEMRSMAAEMRAVKGHIAALVAADAGRDERLAHFELRLERIEARLNLHGTEA